MKNILVKSSKLGVIFACVILITISAAAQASLRKALDFDGDGKADLSVWRPSNNVWYISKSGGGFIFQAFGDTVTDTMTPGDYDGDGKADIAVWRDSNGSWYRLNSSNNTFSGAQFGTTGDEPVARDYDGDGKTDIAVVRRSNGAMFWYVLGSQKGFFAAQFGSATDYTAPGDYDGDGKFDFGVQRPGASVTTDQAIFYILKSSDGGLLSIPWGVGKDLAVPADYDGDGKTDVAVVREGPTGDSALSWYILQSGNGQLKSLAFGATATDYLAQGDYDGDGKTDIGVWRETNGTFYVVRSSNGSLFTSQWGASNDLPIASYNTH